MLLNNLQSRIKGLGLVFSLMFGFVLLSVIGAQAQYYPQQERGKSDKYKNKGDKHKDKGDKHSADRRGNDADDDRDDDDDSDYRNRRSNRDNDDRDDDNDDRYDRQRNNNGDILGGIFGRSNGNNSYSAARREGYSDGLRAGAEDARDGDRYNPRKNSDYKRGADGYDRGDGNRGQYKKAYREAFLQGYNQGYNRRNSVFGNRNRRRGY